MREVVRFKITSKDLCNLGYPEDMRKEMNIAYHQWIKDGKSPLEFKYEIERSLAYVDNFLGVKD